MMTNGSAIGGSIPFTFLNAITSHNPHLFEAYRYDRSNLNTWAEIVSDCLACWRLTAQTFYEQIPETGFQNST